MGSGGVDWPPLPWVTFGTEGVWTFGSGTLGGIGLRSVNLKTKPNRLLSNALGLTGLLSFWIVRGAAFGAAAAKLMDRAFDGALVAGFLAAETVQEFGITVGNAGEASGVVKFAIRLVIPDK